jgi:glycosyltransferase involved in cell wall biosynthesis
MTPLRIQLVTDAWYPQVNGVVRTLEALATELAALGHQTDFVTPEAFQTVPCPSYPEIRLVLRPWRGVAERIEAYAPDAVHIATEGPLGLAARWHCMRRGRPFTTSFHTRFPEYVHARFALPVEWGYRLIRTFHAPARRTMVATPTLLDELRARGFPHLTLWSRGVDTRTFQPRAKGFLDLPRPSALYVGRLAVEKNLDAFLALPLPGTKLVVGDGPERARLERAYPTACFVGEKHGEELARYYADADVFVFPSRTDTFGNVLLEALASGIPIAAYPVCGPIDVIAEARVGCLNEDLGRAVQGALDVPTDRCRRFAEGLSWRQSAEQFLGHVLAAAA